MKMLYKKPYQQIRLKTAYYQKLRGLTQDQPAEQIGVIPAFIGHVKTPNISKALSLDMLSDIATIPEMPPQKLLCFEDP